jgi:hypothetical protein
LGGQDGARPFLKALGKRTAATVKQAAAVARQTLEANARMRGQPEAMPEATDAAPVMTKRGVWISLAAVFGLFLVISDFS